VYKNDAEYRKSDAKFRRLELMFLLTNVFFYETKVFTNQNYSEQKINFKTIDISTFRNKKYQLDFEKTITNPSVPTSMTYDEDNWIAFHRNLTNLEGKNIIYPIKKENLDELLSRFEITDREGKAFTLDVYKKYGSLIGYFLKSSLNDKVFELSSEVAQYFFVNVQDFWKKDFAPTGKEFELKIVFTSEKSRQEIINVSDKEIFKARSHSPGLRILEVKKLVDFLKMPGDHISELGKGMAQNTKSIVLDLYFENRHLGVMLEDNDVVLVDLVNNLKLHHYVGKTIPFNYKALDFFEK